MATSGTSLRLLLRPSCFQPHLRSARIGIFLPLQSFQSLTSNFTASATRPSSSTAKRLVYPSCSTPTAVTNSRVLSVSRGGEGDGNSLQPRWTSVSKSDRRRSSSQNTKPLSSAQTKVQPRVIPNVQSGLAGKTKHENIYTIPNILTFSRLIAAPVVGWLVLHDHHAWACGLFAYAGITDLVDGWIARKWNLQTVVGTVIDPMADKTLMTILTVCLAIKGALPVWLAVIILGRDVGLAIAAIYYRWISLPPPKTFSRYWDFSLPSAEVHPTTISKYNTALQLALIGGTTALPLISADVSVAVTGMQYLVATTTIWSGASYLYSKDAVKILTPKKEGIVKDEAAKQEAKKDSM